MKKFVILLTFPILVSSCTAGLVIGHSNRQTQETNTSCDSLKTNPSLIISR